MNLPSLSENPIAKRSSNSELVSITLVRVAGWRVTNTSITLVARSGCQAKVRARLLSMLGQIQLIHFGVEPAAKEFLDTAERLAPNDGVVLSAVGQYWVRAGKDEEKATACFKRAIEVAPQIPNAYCDLGEFYEGKGDLEKAKSLYEAAINACPGNSLGYGKLMAFLAVRQTWNATRLISCHS